MYNKDRKKQFMSNIKSKSMRQFAETIFTSLAPHETECNIDICDIESKEYPDLLLTYVDVQRLTQLYRGLQVLENYRTYCIAKHWMNPITLAVQYSDQEWALNKEENIATLYNQKHKMVMLRTPNECYDYIVDHYFPQYIRKNVETMLNFKPVIDDLCLCFIMFTYYGLSKQEMAAIRISQIKELPNRQLCIQLDDKTILIEGKFADYVKRFSASRQSGEIMFHNVFHIKQFNKEFLMCFDNENTTEEREKRLDRTYVATTSRLSGTHFPSLVNVQHQGTIYRMVKQEIQNRNEDFREWNLRQWMDVYDFYKNYRSQIVPSSEPPRGTHGFMAKDIKNSFLVEYEFLTNLIKPQ